MKEGFMEYIDISDIDIGRLQDDLINFFGTASIEIPYAKYSLYEISSLDDVALVEFAIANNFDITNYIIKKKIDKRFR